MRGFFETLSRVLDPSTTTPGFASIFVSRAKTRFFELRSFRLLSIFCFLFFAVILLETRFGSLPPLGPFLDPFSGVWARHVSPFEENQDQSTLMGLKSTVRIVVDHQQIKHIFAENSDDVFFAQGYVVASDRLWQMEYLARTAESRLSEIMGRKALASDLFFARLGLAESAKDSLALLNQDPIAHRALESYSKGVNAYIDELNKKRLPIEYLVLGHAPEYWTPLKSALIMKYFAWINSGFSQDLALTKSRSRLTGAEFDELFPSSRAISGQNEQVSGQAHGLTLKDDISLMDRRRMDIYPDDIDLHEFDKRVVDLDLPHERMDGYAWAVPSSRSLSGSAMLASSCRSSLLLPANWYWIQLTSPEIEVLGATIPGMPGLVSGLNADVAWTTQPSQTDLVDWYELRYRDERRSEYLFDNSWRPVVSREVSIPVRDEEPVKVLVRQTHLGPLLADDFADDTDGSSIASPSSALPVPSVHRGLVMRWVGMEPSTDLRLFIALNGVRNLTSCRRALESYRGPSLDLLCADAKGGLGSWRGGLAPIRRPGQGRLVGDGTRADFEWKGWMPFTELSKVPRNMKLNGTSRDWLMVGKSNQDLFDNFESFENCENCENSAKLPGADRGFQEARIAEHLRGKSKLSSDDLLRIQADTLSVAARKLSPALIAALDLNKLDQASVGALKALRSWDFRFEENSVGAAIYEAWLKRVEKYLWESRFPVQGYQYPSLWRTIELISSATGGHWVDQPETAAVETLSAVVTQALSEAVIDLKAATGTSDQAKWTWASVDVSKLRHAGKIDGLAEFRFSRRGSETSIQFHQPEIGSGLQFVVAMDKEPRIWGMYPGGQSGDPRSPFFDSFVQKWAKGDLTELAYISRNGAQKLFQDPERHSKQHSIHALQPLHARGARGL